jgi:hypothetical protein
MLSGLKNNASWFAKRFGNFCFETEMKILETRSVIELDLFSGNNKVLWYFEWPFTRCINLIALHNYVERFTTANLAFPGRKKHQRDDHFSRTKDMKVSRSPIICVINRSSKGLFNNRP